MFGSSNLKFVPLPGPVALGADRLPRTPAAGDGEDGRRLQGLQTGHRKLGVQGGALLQVWIAGE